MSDNSTTATTVCTGCGVELVERDATPPDRYNASGECWQLFGELTAGTMAMDDPTFVHQHCVDAYGAQHPGGRAKPITTAFSLIGLYLTVEKEYTGRQVQQAHMTLGDRDDSWPELNPPQSAGEITVKEVEDADPDDERLHIIDNWVESVWQTWEHSHQWVREVCNERLEIDG